MKQALLVLLVVGACVLLTNPQVRPVSNIKINRTSVLVLLL
jgi:hypothetical protein